jgi:predicted extracellular nuclease
MSSSAGKVALVSNSAPLSGTCPADANIVDFVGYGTGASCFEGVAKAPAPSNTTALLRRQGGCIDTDNNSADFFAGTPNPRNNGSPINDCIEPPTTTVTISQLQGSGSTSPYVSQNVTTTIGIVTGLKSNGFFIQTPDGADDSDPSTSEGVFVFTGNPRPTAAAIGNAVTVKGTVSEFIPSADPNSPPMTEISGSPIVTLISSGNLLPQPIILDASSASPTGSIEQLERYEGMRVSVPSLTVVGPTEGNLSEANATSTSNGIFYGVITGVPRPFREAGIEIPDPLPAGSPPNVPRFDSNPERLRIDSDA